MSKTIQRGVKASETVNDDYQGRLNCNQNKNQNRFETMTEKKHSLLQQRNFISAKINQQKQMASDQ